jgi:hypothetical protein
VYLDFGLAGKPIPLSLSQASSLSSLNIRMSSWTALWMELNLRKMTGRDTKHRKIVSPDRPIAV